ncbi:MAG: glutamate synthase large subunit [Campylobacterales bacterium]|nr:glutamate synthase large subunit [Campylobacterales bacterium]
MGKYEDIKDLIKPKDNCGFGLVANIKNEQSHQLTKDAVVALSRMIHRGAIAADGKSGDGSGLLFSMPKKFMAKVAKENGVDLPSQYAVGMAFLTDEKQKEIIKEQCKENDLKVVLFRDVPVDTNALGVLAQKTLPQIVQVFITPNSIIATKRFEALLYLTRKEIEHQVEDKDFYIPSFSDKVISYKGLVMPTHIEEFYKDLQDDDFEISFALFHQRFSTNTLPEWRLAQPFRTIAHNGEINSVEANRFNVELKSSVLKSEVFTDEELDKILPILQEDVSDSASLDNMLEFLLVNGSDFFKSVRALVPAPWQNAPHMDADLRAFYEYTSTCFEAWDGPAAVSVTNGRYIGCVIDRNGLRPSKYILTKDGNIVISSEYGVLDIEADNVAERGRLQSGQMIGIDLKFGKVIFNEEINDYMKSSQPYAEWLNSNMAYLQEFMEREFEDVDYDYTEFEEKQRYFNITNEVVEQVIKPMMDTGKENSGSMGDDTPLAALSDVQRNFTDFFKQKFAQVTNPPIDPLREKVVMSTNTGFGIMHNILDEEPSRAVRLKAVSPILFSEKMKLLKSFGDPKKPMYQEDFKFQVFYTNFQSDLQGSMEKLGEEIIQAVEEDNIRIVYLDDRKLDRNNGTIPMAMAVGYINYLLLEKKLRHLVSIVAVTGEVYDSHSAAVLLGYGASAIYPYLVFATAVNLARRDELSQLETRQKLKNVQTSMKLGLLKIMSKMGISTVASYRNSALFDVLGLSSEVVDVCFKNSKTLIEGLGFADIENRVKRDLNKAYDSKVARMFPLEMGGFYKYTPNGEHHDYAPEVTNALHKLCITGKKEDYDLFRDMVNGRNRKMLRDFVSLKQTPISIDEVEPASEILKRFTSAAMSMGSISKEAHEALAVAMNELGGMSNSGEGGEEKERLGSEKNSKVKQVASGRFGVTPAYLRSATEIQIKVAQGAKPGEGGQLPGDKVTPLIGKLRFTVPGVTLISPPPHHDIYSIEDLAQLIYDLKQVNPKAKISVKLVSTAGVGTIAAGVAKAYADKIIISGGDGGTGAAALGSIKFAGNPFEIGLCHAHDALKANHLRGLVEVQADGGLKTGMDVVKSAIMGAESYGFGTTLLTALGCKILRVCHLNRCTVGIATQDPTLREHYVGTVDRVKNYLTFIAEDIREILASIGAKSLNDVIGKRELFVVDSDETADKFDFGFLTREVEGDNICNTPSNVPFDTNEFEKEILKKVMATIKNPKNKTVVEETIKNTNRSFGTLISGEIAEYYKDEGLEDDSITLNMTGIAGQSLGAFLSNGVTINVRGIANDYVGKGIHGGKIVIVPAVQKENFSAAGNTCLYGATGGTLFVAGGVGERFAVRNSGCLAVVEGTGDHPCEYMTGGTVVILGETGVNFGAGMTGGVAFVYDKNSDFHDKMNQELIKAVRIDTDDEDEGKQYLKKILKRFLNDTGSKKAEQILNNFRQEIRHFWMVTPKNAKISFESE